MEKELSPDTFIWEKIIFKTYNDIVPKTVRDSSKFILSLPIVYEIIDRFIGYKDLIEDCHQAIKGSESAKIAGYLTYWIAKLKPVQIIEPLPNEKEVYINESLAIFVAMNYFEERGKMEILSKKIINDLKYTLRHRTLTVRVLPIIYDSYITGFHYGIDKKEETLIGKL